MKLILASGSPRRRELLAREGVDFEVITSGVDELLPNSRAATDLARENAFLKAREVFTQHPDRVVLGADTVVVVEGNTLGKPRDLTEGVAMLRELSGRWHQVVTAVALLSPNQKLVFHEETQVLFHELSDEDIKSYQEEVHVLDKAGGYAIQEGGEKVIQEVRGCRDNVMGLPVNQVLLRLKEMAL